MKSTQEYSFLEKKCYILGGPNGAGKTTFANAFLRIEAECLNFINADLIAQGSHIVPEQDIRRRFERSWRNFNRFYKQLADAWVVFDTSGNMPLIIGESE